MAQSEMFVLPVGRFVNGSLTEKRTEDFEGRPIAEDKQQFEIGVAVRKDNPELPGVFQQIMGHAWNEFSRNPAIQQIIQNFDLNNFSWKISDGDRPNKKGQVSQHTQGCWVFYFKSSFPINCCDQNNATMDPAKIVRGYFVDVAFTCAGNGEQGDRAGIYLNPQVVRFIAYGEEIRGGVSADEAFKGRAAPTQLPPGASHTPMASNAMPTAQQQQPQMPAPGNGAGSPAAPAHSPAPVAPVQTPAMPATGYPSNQGNAAPAAMPGGSTGAPQMPQASQQPASSATGYPGANPHPTFANGPQG